MKVTSRMEFVKDFLYEFEHSIVGCLDKEVRACSILEDLQDLQERVLGEENNIAIDIVPYYHSSLTGPRRAYKAKVYLMHDIEEVFCIKTITVEFKY